jgi:delta 1-pyrroline-5-carboxylate dehydrogenase
MKFGAILAAGNTLVMKPSELAPYAPHLLARLAREAGIPDGVMKIVSGDTDAGRALVEHPLVRKISFTGGLSAARQLLASCAHWVKPAVLELGGKAAYLLFDDAKLDEAVFHSAIIGVGACSPGRVVRAAAVCWSTGVSTRKWLSEPSRQCDRTPWATHGIRRLRSVRSSTAQRWNAFWV